MNRLKDVIQSLVVNTGDEVIAAYVDRYSRFSYVLKSNSSVPISLDLRALPIDQQHFINDNLTSAAIQDLPLETVGIIHSSRFDNTLRLQSSDVYIPYGRVLAWSAWYLQLIFKWDTRTFTRVTGKIPFEILEESFCNELTADDTMVFWVNLIKKLVQHTNFNTKESHEQLHEAIKKEIQCQFSDNSLPFSFLSEVNPEILNKLINSETCFLETELTPTENIELCFYLNEKIVTFLIQRGFLFSLFLLRITVSMILDFGLKNDIARCIEIPMESLRHIALGLDEKKLRLQVDKNSPWMKGSELKNSKLFNLSIQISQENWTELVRLIALDQEEQTKERLDKIYLLFLKKERPTQMFYVVYLSALLERGRMYAANSSSVKSEYRKREIYCFYNLLINFKDYVKDVLTKTDLNSKLSFEDIITFFNLYKSSIYEILSIITNDELLRKCLDQFVGQLGC